MAKLRKAKMDDYWRKALKRNFPFVISQVEIHNGGCLLDKVLIEIGERGITGLVGKNGIGKSNLIRLLFNRLCNETSNRGEYDLPLLTEASVTITFKKEGNEDVKTLGVHHDCWCDIEPEIGSYMFDPCNLIPELQEQLKKQTNIEELLEAHGESEMTADDIAKINYLTASRYESVNVIQIEDEFDEFPLLPFFMVKKGAVDYDSRSMGLGELSLLYFYWLFVYLSKLNGKLFLFIEEPESFIPPAAQVRLINILAMLTSEHAVPCVILSHSEHIISRIPRSNVFILRGRTQIESCAKANDEHEPLKVLGLNATKKGILKVEDHAAEILTKCLIEVSSKFVVDSFYYKQSGGVSEIISDLNHSANQIVDFKFIGIFDGDTQGNVQLNGLKENTRHCFLPGEVPPEKLIQNYFYTLNSTESALILDTTEEKMDDALNLVEGLDHHDFFVELARNLDLKFESLFEKLCKEWIKVDANSELVQVFQTSLNEVYKK